MGQQQGGGGGLWGSLIEGIFTSVEQSQGLQQSKEDFAQAKYFQQGRYFQNDYTPYYIILAAFMIIAAIIILK